MFRKRVESRTLKSGSSRPPEQRRKFSKLQFTTNLIDFPTAGTLFAMHGYRAVTVRARSDPLHTTTGALPAPELGHFVPIAAHRIATPLTPMVLRCVVENEDTGISIRATAQILEFCRGQKLGYRPRKNRQSQLPAYEQ